MGLLDEILRQLEEAQGEPPRRTRARPDPAAMPPPERERDEDGAEWDEDDEARPGHAPHIPSRRLPAEPVAAEAPPQRTVTSSAPALAPHAMGDAPAVRIRALMRSPAGIRDALIVREILGPPPGLRLLRRR